MKNYETYIIERYFHIFSAKFQDLHLRMNDQMTSPLHMFYFSSCKKNKKACVTENSGSSPPTRWRWPRMNSCMLPFLCLPHPNGLSSVHQFDAPWKGRSETLRVIKNDMRNPPLVLWSMGGSLNFCKFVADI
jgi:hypothetical protein